MNMQDFYNPEDRAYNDSYIDQYAINAYVAKVFGWMFIGLLVTALVTWAIVFGLEYSIAVADLVFEVDRFGIGPNIVKHAVKQGAAAFVHYSFPRHMSMKSHVFCRNQMRDTCAKEGIKFIETAALDPMGEAGSYIAEQFILDDVSRMVARYGENTAFYSTNCLLQAPLIKSITDNHAIFPLACCPSPFHGFPEAFDIEMGEGIPDLGYIISETSRIAASRNMTGRLSTWPVPIIMMSTSVGVEYAIKWINGEVPKTGIDDKVLMDCINAYIREATGQDHEVTMTSLTEDGKVYNNTKLLLMSYLNY